MDTTQQTRAVIQMDDLLEDTCWRLASHASVARIGFITDDEMQVLPVNYALLGHTVVFRTASGSMLDSLGDGAPVLVEIDHVDETNQTGWSVIIRGIVEKLNSDLLPLLGNTVHPWASDDKDRWLWVRPRRITGRAISRPAPATRFRLPYMAAD